MVQKTPSHSVNTRSSSRSTPLHNRTAHSEATLVCHSFLSVSSVWNSIPNDVRCGPSQSTFMSRLKTYLFRSVYKDLTFYLITYVCVHMYKYIWFGKVIDFLPPFSQKKFKFITAFSLSAYFNAHVYNTWLLNAVGCFT